MMKLPAWLSAIVWASAACNPSGNNVTPDATPDSKSDPTRIPIGFTFETAEGTLTSVGWTGAFHGFKGAPDTSFAVKVTSCPNGVCQFEGPVDPVGPVNPAGAVNRRRCLQQTSKACTLDSDCPLDENMNSTPCIFIYDPPISIPLGGGACAFTYIPVKDTDGMAGIQGTLNLNSSELNLRKLTEKLALNSTSNGTFQGGCPICVGDTSPNDGVRNGTCRTSPLFPGPSSQSDPGLPPDQGAKCDVNRYGDLPGYNYGYSMDCSPTPAPPSGISPTDFSGSFSSSGFRIAITDQSPKCTVPNFSDANCFCGMCSNSPIPTACMSNADCSNNGSCVGASVPTTSPPTWNVPVAGNLCDNGVCDWNETEGLGTCTSTQLGRKITCYPAAVMGIKGPDGRDVSITVPGRGTVQDNIYYADTASARCTRAGPLEESQPTNRQVGLPGLTFQKRNFRIIPTYVEAQK